MHRTAGQIHEHLSRATNIVLLSHQEPDGDAMGSVNAMYEYLNTLGKKVRIVSGTPVNPQLSFLPHNEKVQLAPEIFNDPEIDAIIVLDSSDLRHTTFHEHVKKHTAKVINIDHHATNERYGHLNMVIDTAASTTEILYLFFHYNNIQINRVMATAILTGLITDTDNFTNSATTALSLAAAGEMTRYGANISLIQRHTTRNKSINTLKLWGLVLSRLKKDEETELAYTYLTIDDLDEFDVDETAVNGVANFLNRLKEARVYAVLRETRDYQVKVSLRTTDHDTDVSKIAHALGGGGHKKAAGATTSGDHHEVANKILTILKNKDIMK